MEVAMSAGRVMNRNVVTVLRGTPVSEVVRLMHTTGHGGLPVVDRDGRVLGMATKLAILRLCLPRYAEQVGDMSFLPADFEPFAGRFEHAGEVPIEQVMEPCPPCISEETSLGEVAVLMITKRVRQIPVVRGGKLVGIVGLQDLIDEIVRPHIRGSDAGT
jgi:CBS domain-containing protein